MLPSNFRKSRKQIQNWALAWKTFYFYCVVELVWRKRKKCAFFVILHVTWKGKYKETPTTAHVIHVFLISMCFWNKRLYLGTTNSCVPETLYLNLVLLLLFLYCSLHWSFCHYDNFFLWLMKCKVVKATLTWKMLSWQNQDWLDFHSSHYLSEADFL